MTGPACPATWRDLPVTLCHDWLVGMRGGERVIELLAAGFPRAEIATLIYRGAALSPALRHPPVHTSILNRLPGVTRYYRNLLPLFPLAARTIRMPRTAELAISTNHCVAKAFPRDPRIPHLCYCFTPMRYAWIFHDEYFGRGPGRLLLKPILATLRAWDRRTAQRITHITAISRHVQARIRATWGRASDVVYPPVNTTRCTPGDAAARASRDDFDLLVSALVPYKRVDLAVEAYRRLNRQLVIVGTGSSYARCKAMAPPNVSFTGWLSDDDVLDRYRRCRMLVFPGEEDFGIVPVEAQSCGKPVVAFARGGALETVVNGQTGIFFDAQTPAALAAAVEDCAARHWEPDAIRAHALHFDEQVFIDGIAAAIDKTRAGAESRL